MTGIELLTANVTIFYRNGYSEGISNHGNEKTQSVGDREIILGCRWLKPYARMSSALVNDLSVV